MHRSSLRILGTDHADVLLLGYHDKRPPQRLIDRAVRMKEQGLVRFLGVTSHNRKLFPELAKEGIFDVFHVRYNAASSRCGAGGLSRDRPQNGSGAREFYRNALGQIARSEEDAVRRSTAHCCRLLPLRTVAPIRRCLHGWRPQPRPNAARAERPRAGTHDAARARTDAENWGFCA